MSVDADRDVTLSEVIGQGLDQLVQAAVIMPAWQATDGVQVPGQIEAEL
jgi:hypothetical protein